MSRTTPRQLVAPLAVLAVASGPLFVPPLVAPAAAAEDGRVLTSMTTNPTGGAVTSTFTAARVESARDGWQGSSSALPSSPTARPGAQNLTGQMRLDGEVVTSPRTSEIPYQRFDLAWRGAGQRVVWSGSLDSARGIVLSAWDGTQWQELTRGRGLGPDQLTLEGQLESRHSTNGTVHLLVHAEDPFADDLDNEVKFGFEDPSDYDFSIAHHSDTQHMVRGSVTKTTPAERLLWKRGFTDATQWIADNAKARKIVFAAHTGDLIEDWVNTADTLDPAAARAQFAEASDAQRILDEAGVVNSTLPGNHDNLHGADPAEGPGSLFNEYFPPSRYEALAATESWQTAGATYAPWRAGDNSNSVTTFTAGGLDFVAVSLGFKVTAEEAAWADSVLKSYPDRNAIVLAHAYTTASPSPDGRGNGMAEDGDMILKRVIEPNPNVALVLSGHKEGVSIGVRKDVGRADNHVLELMANYQYYTFEAGELGIDLLGGYSPTSTHRLGASFLRLLQFDVDRSEVSVDTYSPYRNIFGATGQDAKNRYDGREDDTRLPVQLNSRTTSFRSDAVLSVAPSDEQIGQVTGPSGSAAEVSWSNLTAGRTYGWSVQATDAATGQEIAGANPIAWFVARNGGDTTAPRLTVPGSTTLAHGAEFDPMKGVSARDDDGTSLTSSVVVTGRIDTSTPGAQPLSYVVSDRAGNTAVATRRVVVSRPPAPVNTGVPRVTGKAQIGEVLTSDRGQWTNLGNADVKIQWIRNGSAIVGATGTEYLLTPSDVGKLIRSRITVRAAGRTALEVISEPARPGKLKPTFHKNLPAKVSKKKKALLKVRYSNEWTRPSGTVTVHANKKRIATINLSSSARAQVRLPKMKPGTKTITIAYSGSGVFNPTTHKLKIKVTKK